LPEPKEGEGRQEFISRCMGSEEAKNDFPEQDQRVAFCINQFERMSKTSPTSNSVHVPSTENEKENLIETGDIVQFVMPGKAEPQEGIVESIDEGTATVSLPDGSEGKYKLSELTRLNKRQLVRDKFTTRREARIRSRELGLGGHTHQHTTDNGAIFMPGRSHQEYVMAVTALEGVGSGGMFKDVVEGVMKYVTSNRQSEGTPEIEKSSVFEDKNYSIEGKILKVDEDQKIIYGWASVITEKGEPVVDTQGDIITSEELIKAVNDFMEDDRTGKLMHSGDKAGTIIHSFPITNDIAKALGLDTDREGWIVGYKPNDPNVIEKVKSGELTGFSIGGNAQRIEVDG